MKSPILHNSIFYCSSFVLPSWSPPDISQFGIAVVFELFFRRSYKFKTLCKNSNTNLLNYINTQPVSSTVGDPLPVALAGQGVPLQPRAHGDVGLEGATATALDSDASGLGPHPRGLDHYPWPLHQPGHVVRLPTQKQQHIHK